MTDKEIVRALEICSNAEDILVKGQTYKNEPLSNLFKEALDLINRQKEQIDGLIKGQETLQKYIAEQKAEIESRRAEVEELKFRLDQNNDEGSKIGIMFEETLKENEDLKKKVEFLSGQCEAYKYCISKIGGE